MVTPVKNTAPIAAPTPPPRIAAGARAVATSEGKQIEEVNHKFGVGISEEVVYNEFAESLDADEGGEGGGGDANGFAVEEEDGGGDGFAEALDDGGGADVGASEPALRGSDAAFLQRLAQAVRTYESNVRLFEGGSGGDLGGRVNVFL